MSHRIAFRLSWLWIVAVLSACPAARPLKQQPVLAELALGDTTVGVSYERQLTASLGLEVGMRSRGRGRGGVLTIRWRDEDQLSLLLGRLR